MQAGLADKPQRGQMRASEVPTMSVEALIPYTRNSRTHSEDQVAQIAASIREFGFTNPVLVDGKGVIIAGHGRVMAAKVLGLAEVPVLVLDHLTDAQRRAYVIADNKLALNAGWDEAALQAEIAALTAVEFDTDILGFNADELAALLNPPSQSEADPDQTPEPPAFPVSQAGDVWILGGHRIICGDSTDAETITRLLAGKKADLCLTDPPYGIGFGYGKHDDSDNDANAQLVAKVFALAPPGKVWTPGGMNLGRDINRFGKARVLIWHKGFAAAGNGLGGASTIEPVLVIEPPRRKLPNDYLDFKTDREQLGGKSLVEYHPCPKPVALFTHLAEAFCPEKGSIYEPFSGSGTTLIASEMTGRTCFACELDPAYVDVAVRRWEEFTGKTAALEATGQTFQEVQDERRRQAAA